jgi:hypothetical protein
MEKEKFSITGVVPNKVKLSDYEFGHTLGTGNL